MKKTILFIFLISAFVSFSQTYSTGTQTLLSGLSANIEISDDTDLTTLTLTGPSNVWFAIGFGNQNMQGADVFRTNGTSIIDAYSSGNALPSADSSQDWMLVSNFVSSGTRTIVATRANNTGDSNDYVFNASAGSLSVIYAKGTSSSYGYHGGNRGFTTLSVTLGVSENKLLSFEMYPNPVLDELNIQLPTGTHKAEVGVFDYTGRLVASKTISSNDASIDVQKIAKGIYIIRVSTDAKVGAQKFIKN